MNQNNLKHTRVYIMLDMVHHIPNKAQYFRCRIKAKYRDKQAFTNIN